MAASPKLTIFGSGGYPELWSRGTLAACARTTSMIKPLAAAGRSGAAS